jgi:hypothetical protein
LLLSFLLLLLLFIITFMQGVDNYIYEIMFLRYIVLQLFCSYNSWHMKCYFPCLIFCTYYYYFFIFIFINSDLVNFKAFETIYSTEDRSTSRSPLTRTTQHAMHQTDLIHKPSFRTSQDSTHLDQRSPTIRTSWTTKLTIFNPADH